MASFHASMGFVAFSHLKVHLLIYFYFITVFYQINIYACLCVLGKSMYCFLTGGMLGFKLIVSLPSVLFDREG